MEQESNSDLEVLTLIISSLKKLSKDDQLRTLQSVATFLNISLQGTALIMNSGPTSSTLAVDSPSLGASSFSEDRSISPKDFIRDKAPRSDVDRVACLAYYLTHYKDTPHFKTLDISTLNTEAAQPKFSNASVAVENAVKAGILVQATKGNKQISAAGERYVQYLPDQAAAKASIQGIRQKKKPRKTPVKKHESIQDEN
ncbi:MAG: hypothetical protein KKD92_05855 [Proteobacteria bacterium]|nr:hypothetical protein [Pseudomonadota bacterium]